MTIIYVMITITLMLVVVVAHRVKEQRDRIRELTGLLDYHHMCNEVREEINKIVRLQTASIDSKLRIKLDNIIDKSLCKFGFKGEIKTKNLLILYLRTHLSNIQFRANQAYIVTTVDALNSILAEQD